MVTREARRRGADGRVVAVSALTLLVVVLLPWADRPLGFHPSFLSSYVTAFLLVDMLTAFLLTHQFLITGSRRTLVLAWAFVWCGLTVLGHLLALPGLLTESGPLADRLGSSPWLWTAWHVGYPALLALACCRWPGRLDSAGPVPPGRRPRLVVMSYAVLLVLAGVLTVLVTRLAGSLGKLVGGNDYSTRFWPAILAVNVVALLVVATSSRRGKGLRRWVVVATAACLGDVILTFVSSSRYTVGWYGARGMSLAASSVVLIGLLAAVTRMSRELATSSERLRRLAETDALTGLLNRRTSLAAGEGALAASLSTGYGVAIALIDVDFFKRVNDGHGHAIGDDVLVTVARRMEGALRDGDVLGRYGGEEFVAVLPHTSGLQAEAVMVRLLESVRSDPIRTKAGPLAITVSIGVTLWVRGERLGETLARADVALYAAKAAGRNRFVLSVDAAQGMPAQRDSPELLAG